MFLTDKCITNKLEMQWSCFNNEKQIILVNDWKQCEIKWFWRPKPKQDSFILFMQNLPTFYAQAGLTEQDMRGCFFFI